MFSRISELNATNIAAISCVRTRDVPLAFAWSRIDGNIWLDDKPASSAHLAEIFHDRLDIARYRVAPCDPSDGGMDAIARAFTEPIADIKACERIVARIGDSRVFLLELASPRQISIADLFFAHLTAYSRIDPCDDLREFRYDGKYKISVDISDNVIVWFGCAQ